MIVIVKNVTVSSEGANLAAAGQELETDLNDLLEYVRSVYMKKQRLTRLNDSAL